jgi:hypothetical protein
VCGGIEEFCSSGGRHPTNYLPLGGDRPPQVGLENRRNRDGSRRRSTRSESGT